MRLPEENNVFRRQNMTNNNHDLMTVVGGLPVCPPVQIPNPCLTDPAPALLREMRAESQCGGKRGHCFPEGRLAARAINYKRQGDRQLGSQPDRQTDRQTVPQRERRQAWQEQARHIQREDGARTKKQPCPCSASAAPPASRTDSE